MAASSFPSGEKAQMTATCLTLRMSTPCSIWWNKTPLMPPSNGCPTLGAGFQATVRSAAKTFPLVSGLNSTATRKMAKPTTVVTRIGPERAMY
jgi:hypothetical protein